MLWAMLACGMGAGLRRFEIANLRADALSDDGRHLLVVGKGRKEAVQPIPAAVGGALEAWLAEREGVIDDGTPFMFVPLTRGDRPLASDKPLSIDAVERMIAAASRGYGGAPFTPHDLRRTFGSKLLDAHDMATVRRLMRHANIATTARYDKRPDAVAEKAAASLDALIFGRAAKLA
jgi:integrase